jgi:hypothetical protein
MMNNRLNRSFFFFLLGYLPACCVGADLYSRQASTDTTSNGLNRQVYYQAMEGNNRSLVDSELVYLRKDATGNLGAFTGALIMKKAGMGGSATTKLHLFKQGHQMLEAAIKQDPDNTEYRFLRLMIQENAPGFLGYKNDLEKDSAYIRKTYKSLPSDLQQAILRYNKKSKVLKLDLS